jgi:hypothetical protein
MVKETGVSYYGLTYPEHAERDFREMVEHNCTGVVLAITEFDLHFWYPNIPKIVKVAKDLGLTTHLDLWGIGKFFGGEPPSLFLQEHTGCRQVGALSNQPLPAACFNSPAFRRYFYGWAEKLAQDTEADGFFWDEPHYALDGSQGGDWTCRCPICQEEFRKTYGYEMPRALTADVLEFRQEKGLEVLVEAARRVKAIDPKLKVTACVLPTYSTYYTPAGHGYGDWERVASTPEFDVFSTSIIGYDQPHQFFIDVGERTVQLAKKYGKESQRWIMSYFQSPPNLNYIKELVHLYAKQGVDSIYSWTYRAGKGTILSAPDPDSVWRILGEAYGEALTGRP